MIYLKDLINLIPSKSDKKSRRKVENMLLIYNDNVKIAEGYVSQIRNEINKFGNLQVVYIEAFSMLCDEGLLRIDVIDI